MDPQQILLDMSRTLGGVVEKLEGLARDVTESREESNSGRRRLYDRLAENEAKAEGDAAAVMERLARLEQLAAATAEKATATAAQLAGIQPTIDAFGRLKQRGIGAIAVIGFVATILGGAIALKWDAIVAAVTRFLSPGA